MKKLLFLIVVPGVLLTGFLLGPRADIHTSIAAVFLPDDLDDYLSRSEAAIPDVIPGTEKTIRWAETPGRQTNVSVVYLHGLSASRQEVAPFADMLADSLGANLFYSRLRGHGRTGQALGNATANDWLNDAVEATVIGERIGRKVLVVGTSTGGTLAAWLASSPYGGNVLGLILLSPNFGPANRAARVLLWPWGLQIAQAVQGATHSFEPANELQATYWTTRYPTRTLAEMMALVDLVKHRLDRIHVPILAFHSTNDRVVDIAAVKTALGEITPQAVIHEVADPVGPSGHILAGDILSPHTTGLLVDRSLAFVRAILRDTTGTILAE
jgi:esterase/lipase